jgi:hypothetical protein
VFCLFSNGAIHKTTAFETALSGQVGFTAARFSSLVIVYHQLGCLFCCVAATASTCHSLHRGSIEQRAAARSSTGSGIVVIDPDTFSGCKG